MLAKRRATFWPVTLKRLNYCAKSFIKIDKIQPLVNIDPFFANHFITFVTIILVKNGIL